MAFFFIYFFIEKQSMYYPLYVLTLKLSEKVGGRVMLFIVTDRHIIKDMDSAGLARP
ncbi:hypothetical protein YSY43_37760 [Paenibacillus sp. YSY-4.3]